MATSNPPIITKKPSRHIKCKLRASNSNPIIPKLRTLNDHNNPFIELPVYPSEQLINEYNSKDSHYKQKERQPSPQIVNTKVVNAVRKNYEASPADTARDSMYALSDNKTRQINFCCRYDNTSSDTCGCIII